MNKSITQDTQNDNQISKTIRRFFTRFHVTSALKSANAYKNKGIPVVEIFQYLFNRFNVFIVDDSMFERNRSKKAALLTKVYDHAKHAYKFGFAYN